MHDYYYCERRAQRCACVGYRRLSGLGRAMAQALDGAGARLAVSSRDTWRAQAAAAELDSALGVTLDVRDVSSVAAAVDAVYDKTWGS